jgi:toxin YoeB
MYQVLYSRQAQKDARKLSRSNLRRQAQETLEILAQDPFQTPTRHESLVGELARCFYRRINLQHRIVYEVFPDQGKVLILRMWTHFGE